MGIASYQRRYKRVRGKGRAHGAAYVSNPASHFTDQGADAHPADLGWCIRREWRVIYYSYRHAARLPLWDGVTDFEILMADVLFRLSRDFEPIAPIRSAKVASELASGPVSPRCHKAASQESAEPHRGCSSFLEVRNVPFHH